MTPAQPSLFVSKIPWIKINWKQNLILVFFFIQFFFWTKCLLEGNIFLFYWCIKCWLIPQVNKGEASLVLYKLCLFQFSVSMVQFSSHDLIRNTTVYKAERRGRICGIVVRAMRHADKGKQRYCGSKHSEMSDSFDYRSLSV